VPKPTPETEHYWEGTRLGELRIQRCNACGQAYFYPRPSCPLLLVDRRVVAEKRREHARLHTYLISPPTRAGLRRRDCRTPSRSSSWRRARG
jgi:uncharacterized protein